MVVNFIYYICVGMYADGDPYGEEIDGEEDRNDGLNALVIVEMFIFLEFVMGDRFQQRD